MSQATKENHFSPLTQRFSKFNWAKLSTVELNWIESKWTNCNSFVYKWKFLLWNSPWSLSFNKAWENSSIISFWEPLWSKNYFKGSFLKIFTMHDVIFHIHYVQIKLQIKYFLSTSLPYDSTVRLLWSDKGKNHICFVYSSIIGLA